MKRLALLVLLLFATPAHATVNEVFARNEYVVAGSGTVFPYTFKILDKVQITVMVNGVIKNLDTDYSVSGVGDSGGGAVTFVTTPGNGASVVLIRDQPVQQLSTYTANEAFPATRLMNDLDKNIMVDQMQQEEIGRALKFDPYSLFKDVFIDTPVAGKCLAWNSARTRVINADCAAGSGGGGELPPGLVTGSALPGQVTFWSGANTIAGDTKFLWDNSTKALTVGTTPLGGPLKPGNVFIGLQAPSDATGMQALMVQTYQGAPGLAGLVTLGDDRVGISSWNFRGTGATNPIYGANFGVVFNTPGVANGLEIDVQNDSTTNYIGQALWLNGSTRATGTPGTVGHRANAILIDTQDGSKWERGILFKEGFVGNGATGSIEKMGIHFEHSQDADFIVIQPRVGQSANIAFKLTNPEFTVNRFELLNSGAIRVGTTMTGPAFPSYAFVEEQTTGLYLESPSVLGFAISGPLVPGPGVGGFRRMTLGTALNIYPSAATPNNTGTLNLWDQFSAHSVGFMAPDFVGNSFRIRLPNAPGFSGQCLVTNGAFPIETWSYAACGSGGPGGGTVTNTGVLTLNALILGDGGVAVKPMSSLGTTTTVLHGNASGVPTFGPVLVPDIGATGTPSATTFLRGDGTWSTPPGTGTVTTSGSPVSGQVAFMTSSTAISGAPELTWSGSNILTLGTGTSVSLYSIKTALLNEIKHGTAAAPVTTLGPTTKISKIQNYTTIPMAGCTVGANGQIDAECGATLLVHNQSLSSSLQQGTAIAGYSSGDNSTTGGGSGDQVGVIGLGRKAGGTGVATGSYFEGQRFAAGSGVVAGGILAFGSEIRHTNMTAVDCFYDGSIPTCVSAWLSAGGTPGVKKGVGAMVFDTDTVATMQAGFACSVKSVASPGACFDDNSVGSGSGIRIGGSKSVGIEEVSTSIIGMRLLGTYSSNEAIRMKQGNLIAWQNVPGTATIFINGDATNKQIRVGGDLVLEHSTAAAKLYLLDQGSATHFTRMDAGTGTGGFTLNTTVGGVLNKRLEINTLGQFFFTPTTTTGTFGFAANGTRRTEVQFHTDNNTNAVSLVAPATATGNHVWTLPSTMGAADTMLRNDGTGTLSWVPGVTTSGTPASGQVALMSGATSITGDSNFTWSALDELAISGTVFALGPIDNEDTISSFVRTSAVGNLHSPLFLRANSTGQMINSFGPGIFFSAADVDNVHNNAGVIGFGRDGSDTTYNFSVVTYINGVAGTRFRINGEGQATYLPTPTVGSFQLAANGTRRTELQFFTNSNTNAVSLIAPATATGNHVWTLPSTFGAAGEVLTNTGGGVLAWTASGGVTGSGTANRIGYWSGASTLTSAAGFTFDGVAMTIPGNLLATALTPDVSSSNPRLIVTEGASTPVGDVTAWRPYMRFILNNTATDRKSAIYIESINTGAPVSASRVNSGIQVFHASAQDNGGEVSGISSVEWLDGNAGTFQRDCRAVGSRPGSLPACVTSRAAGFSLEINGSGNMSNAISGSLDTTSTVISYAASVNSPGTGALQPAGFVAFTANDTLNLHLREAIRVMGTGLETTGAYSAAAVRFLVTMDGATRVGPSLANMGQGTINTSVGYYTNNAAPVMPSLAGADLRLVTVSASGQLGAAAIVAGISTTIAVRNSADTGSCTIGFVGGIAVSTTC